MINEWKPHPKYESGTHNSWVVLNRFEQEYHEFEARINWDGCIEFYKSVGVPFGEGYGFSRDERDIDSYDDYIHICDLDEMIEVLIKLKATAISRFGKHWGK